MASILIVEDNVTFATMMQTWLKKKGFVVDKVDRVAAAVKALNGKSQYDLVLSDLRLPDHDGLELLAWMKKHEMATPFIMMTSYAEVQNAVAAMKMGASDYIAKPIQPDMLLEKINDALASSISSQEKTTEKKPDEKKPTPRCIRGKSEAARQLYQYVDLVAPTPMSVLILGASGTGKEYVARQIHELSQRHDKPFYAIDCGAIPKDVAASEFFGYKKGAFTGADSDKKGAFEAAMGGTLFLDEVGNLSYDVQVQLLRALQEKRIRPVGGSKEVDVDIRLVCATNENLAERVAEGKFREDLYHRINEFTIRMPELRERGTDLFLFMDLFLSQANEELGRNVVGFDAKASEMLAGYSWPGNLRELKNVVKRATLLARGQYIGSEELRLSMEQPGSQPHDPISLKLDEKTEQERIAAALNTTNGNKAKAARLLGIDRKTLYNKIERYGIDT